MAKKFTKKQLFLIVGTALVVASVGTGIVVHNNKAEAARVALAKEDAAKYKKLQKEVEKTIQTAYDTRGLEMIEKSKELIKKLKKSDKKEPTEKIQKLEKFIQQVKEAEALVVIAEKSKKDEDIAKAQKAVDEEKDPYLENDKKGHQERLDKLKKAIADEKAKKAAEDKAKAEKEKAEQEALNAANEANQAAETVQATQEESYEPVTPQVFVQQGGGYTAPQAPATPAPAPSQPSGSGNGGGNSSNNGYTGGKTQEEDQKEINEAAKARPFG
ncbi:hypothetical protein SAMN02745116_00357 [Pilibacter termitis]|uniref:Uncharacterized protein n=1 Tax=Pilibacter termitis TaxID=263852 RepID=A0A1T4KS63_9ENTE|nr:hypothetical protein [Pilibacter termitis]SJZ45213.1 hypothetical protein SAMN02745116_00357 [Pilibacter termitis]